MAYQDFYNDMNKDLIRGVLFFYGAEDFLMDWAIDQIIDRYVDESARNLDVQILDGEAVSVAEIMGAARTFSMFSEKRVVIVKNFLPVRAKATVVDADKLVAFCGEPLEQALLIFVTEAIYENSITVYGKKLMKASKSYEFAKPDKAALQSFIGKRVKAAGKMLGRLEMNYLIDLSGYYNKESEYTLAQLDSDLQKITSACEDDRITGNLIDELLIGKDDKYVFNLVDALMTGNKAKAMEIAEVIIREDDGAMGVMALLTKQFEIMYDTLELELEGLSIGQMAKLIGVNEFRIKKAYQAARSFSLSRIKDILIRAYDTDKEIKMGELDRNLAFELLIVSI